MRSPLQKLIALLCLAALLAAALAAPGAVVFFAILAPLWLYFGTLTPQRIEFAAVSYALPGRPFLTVLASRPPPAA